MNEGFVSITVLARRTGVSAKALRHWEGLGLLPKASRTRAGYRVFPQETAAYIEFVKRSKTMGLTLRQMKSVLGIARGGQSPCPAVETWIAQRIGELEAEIRSLSRFRTSLQRILECQPQGQRSGDRKKECCSLLVGLLCRSRGQSDGDQFQAARAALRDVRRCLFSNDWRPVFSGCIPDMKPTFMILHTSDGTRGRPSNSVQELRHRTMCRVGCNTIHENR